MGVTGRARGRALRTGNDGHEEATRRALKILQVSTYDVVGGAERVAWGLSQAYRAQGHTSWLAVGQKLSDDPHVLVVPNRDQRGRWRRFWDADVNVQPLEDQVPQGSPFRRLRQVVGDPRAALERYRGIEDFRFPGTWRLLTLTRQRPDVVHCHNLHGGFFDLRALPWLSQHVSVFLTLHDAWLLSGHCAHSFDCERWKTGCGHCPDLTIPPAVQRDATAYNWKRKNEIFKGSRLCIATPSRWLMQKVEQSMLASAAIEARVIPNGVDLSVFHPADREGARATLGIQRETRVVFFAATAVRRNPWKDYETAREAVALTAQSLNGQDLLFLVLGEDAPRERIGRAQVLFVPHERDPEAVARCYQAADVYAHAARADTFPNTVLEALACGTPVVATAVGGIPEQVEEARTGFLVPAGDPRALADRLTQLLLDDDLRRRMGLQAAQIARRDFGLHRQANAYLDWYHDLVRHRRPGRV